MPYLKKKIALLFLAGYIPYAFAAKMPEETKEETVTKDRAVENYTLKHAKKNINNNVDDFEELEEDLKDSLQSIHQRAGSTQVLMCVILSNVTCLPKPKVLKKNQQQEGIKEEGNVYLTNHYKQHTQGMYKKYTLASTTGLLDEQAHKLTHKLGIHIVQTNPSHIIPALCQFIQINPEKHVIYLALNAPICSQCHYLLKEIIGYTREVKYQKDGCQDKAFVWPMPKLAMDYVNACILASKKPLEVTERVLHKLLGISIKKSQTDACTIAELRKELDVKENIITNRDNQVRLLQNQLTNKEQAITNRDNQLTLLGNQLEDKQETIINKERQVTLLNNQLNNLKQEKAALQKALKEQKKLRSDKEEKTASNPKYTCLHTLKGHNSHINSVAFAPDGKTLASASSDGSVNVWDTAKGTCLYTLKGNMGNVNVVVFGPDGKTIALASKEVKIWDIAKRTCLCTIMGHQHNVNSVMFARDGKTIISASYDSSVKVWDIAKGTCLRTMKGHDSDVNSLTFAPDGKILAFASGDQTIRIWDIAKETRLCTMIGHTGEVHSVAFAPDSKTLASASYDHSVKVWDSFKGTCLRTMKGHTDVVCSVAFAPDGKTIASASYDQTIKIWDRTKGTCLRSMKGHTSIVCSIAFAPDGKTIATASYDKTIRIWKV